VHEALWQLARPSVLRVTCTARRLLHKTPKQGVRTQGQAPRSPTPKDHSLSQGGGRVGSAPAARQAVLRGGLFAHDLARHRPSEALMTAHCGSRKH
jgi:hypothetical protein